MRKAITILFISLLSCINAMAVQSGKCGDSATWTLSNGTLTICGSGEISAFDINKSKVKRVVIEDGITTIGFMAFENYKRLRRVKLPSSTKEIRYSFSGCKKLKEIICKAETPPHKWGVYGPDVNIPIKSTTLYVPKKSIQAYKEDNAWNMYKNIKTIESKKDTSGVSLNATEYEHKTKMDILTKYKWEMIADKRTLKAYEVYTRDSVYSYHEYVGYGIIEDVSPYYLSFEPEKVFHNKKIGKSKEGKYLVLNMNGNVISRFWGTINDSIMTFGHAHSPGGCGKVHYKAVPKDEKLLKVADILKKHQWIRQLSDNNYEIRSFSDKAYTYVKDGENETSTSRQYYISEKPDKRFKRHKKRNGSNYIIEKGSTPYEIIEINDTCLRLHNVIDRTDYIFTPLPK